MTVAHATTNDRDAMTERVDTTQMDDDRRWQAVLAHDTTQDGTFVYAVRSTGIYCRPGCPSRRPHRERVEFFPVSEAARHAGYRACHRCHPDSISVAPDYVLVSRVCAALHDDQREGETTLAALGASLAVSPFHLQRTFKRVMGITPRQYADACRLNRFKSGVRAGERVTDAIYDAGYGSASRLYEHTADRLGMTPGEYRRGGDGTTIRYTLADSPLGRLLVAGTARGICVVSLGDDDSDLEDALAQEYPVAIRERDDAGLGTQVVAILAHLRGDLPRLDLPLDVRATAFQWRVWEALRAIPSGETRSYMQIAAAIGQPTAARAVARACATNPAALVIPCHRVVREGGALGGYRWGLERKRALLTREGADADAQAATGNPSTGPDRDRINPASATRDRIPCQYAAGPP